MKIMSILFPWASILLLGCFGSCTNSQPLVIADTRFYCDSLFTSGIEGPACNAAGDLFVVNYQKEGTVGVVFRNGKASLFTTLPKGSVGNGIVIGPEGHLYLADYTMHTLWKINAQTGACLALGSDTMMNQPNDLCIDRKGNFYFSDPKWSDGTGQLWYWSRIDSSMHLLEDSMGTTNGLDLSPDDKNLYVGESKSGKVYVYDAAEGVLSNKRLFYSFPNEGMDGMRTDKVGNLYITRYGHGVVEVISPAGKPIKTIRLIGAKPTNVAFGGVDGKTLYITMQDSGRIEVYQNDIAGRSFGFFTP
jgi:gluconolactonase